MTLRKCILLQSHLESFIQLASEDPALKIVVPGLQRSLDDIGAVKRKLVGTTTSNVTRLVLQTATTTQFRGLDETGSAL